MSEPRPLPIRQLPTAADRKAAMNAYLLADEEEREVILNQIKAYNRARQTETAPWGTPAKKSR